MVNWPYMTISPKNKMGFQEFLEHCQQRINTFLGDVLPSTDLPPQHLHQAMHYAVLNGGKRIRPLLVYATGEAFGVDLSILDYPASSAELIHAYSLVHDDLPAMDNDDLRRGQPTCHKAFDEATAILVGDALQTLAYSVLADKAQILPTTTRLAMISCLAKATGSLGMAGGQALDLKATGQQTDNYQLELIHNLKTGSLISACIELGSLAGNVEENDFKVNLAIFAKYIGLCFQIQDDILNHEGATSTLGKTAGTDEANQKATFTTINGLEKAKESLLIYYQQAMKALSPFEDRVARLKSLAEYIVLRDH